MAIDESGFTKGQVKKLNAARNSVSDDLAEEVFGKWLEREVAAQVKGNPDPVAMKIVEALIRFENDQRFILGNHGHTIRRVKGKGAWVSLHARMRSRKRRWPRLLKLCWSRHAKGGRSDPLIVLATTALG